MPVTPDAVKDVVQMMPSKHLLLPSKDKAMMVPSMEGILGLFQLTGSSGSSDESYATLAEARSAYRAGKVRPDKLVTVAGKRTSPRLRPAV